MVERAFLVGLRHPRVEPEAVEELLDELEELVTTLGVGVRGRMVAPVRKNQSRYLVGPGKAEEIVAAAKAARADVIVFDDPITPSQQRNWESLSKLAVIDRQEVILDIFHDRAQSREAELQVALARAEYDLPRLRRRWTHLHRQRGAAGGLGGRGEGEQQVEVDARLVRGRITNLEKRLREVRKQRGVQRKQRLRKPIPVGAIVGYTNAGKSSILNALTQADVLAEDKLFATLDPTVRRVALPNNQELLLSDTVGFIRKLPHQLVEAFKSTLEEVIQAEFLVEVLDISGRLVDEHHETTREVLRELGAWDKPVIRVYNKIDLVDSLTVRRYRRKHPDAVFVTATNGMGLDELRQRLADELTRKLYEERYLIPHSRYDLVSLLHRTGDVLEEKHEDNGVNITARVSGAVLDAVSEFAQRA